jgi:hypothetical protein
MYDNTVLAVQVEPTAPLVREPTSTDAPETSTTKEQERP